MFCQQLVHPKLGIVLKLNFKVDSEIQSTNFHTLEVTTTLYQITILEVTMFCQQLVQN
jgi:hypothetical protein